MSEPSGNLHDALAGKTILVTGAGRGLGHGVCRGLAAYGAAVVAVARTESELAELAHTVRSAGGEIETIVADLAAPEETARLAGDLLTRFGGVDALVNNASILRMKPFLELSAEDFDETIEVNLLAPVRLIRALLPAMLARGRGAIVNVSSAAGVRPFADETDYCAAKYGLEGFSYSLAMELAPRNVSVNLVTPGYRIKPTSVTAAEFSSWPEERQAQFRDPIDMADAFAYLAVQQPAAGGVTGQRFDAFELAEEVRRTGGMSDRRDAPAREGIGG